tara:strand:+ start:4797 stop:7709 length:2913 start_codon:yes stop_codon:yes gene_type:complete
MDNFLGTPFDPAVKTQVEVRQNSLGKYSNIPSKDLQYYTTKTPFLRLASSVDLEFYNPLVGVPKQLKNLGYDIDTWDGDYLAKSVILQGGVVSLNEDNKFGGLQTGLNNGSNLFNGAYGWGGTAERGYVPMPGITNADVTYYSNGALAKTTINIKCFSKAQFQLIDILYLRPGYTLLLEFGHSVWLDNEEKLQSMDNFLTEPMSKFLTPEGTNQYELYKTIEKARKDYDYNYEAVYGKISNFNWQFNSDGSYDCQVQLTSIGDVISSLKCNITDPSLVEIKTDTRGFWKKLWTSDPDPTKQPPLVANANKTIINRELYGIYQSAQSTEITIPTLIDYKLLNYMGVTEKTGKPTTPGFLKFKKGLLAIPSTVTDSKENESPQVYIKYGAFLAYLQSKVLLYNNKKSTPHVVFDMDFFNLDEDENVILKVPGQFSADPRVCLIPYTNTNFKDENVNIPTTGLNKVLSRTKWDYETYLGRIGNIMVNINYLAACLVDGEDDKGNINVINYLKIINSGIIKALGDINEFTIKLSDDGLKMIFNENIPQRREKVFITSEYTRFNVYGVKPGIGGSFIRSVNLNASIPSNFASMISIGAQSNGNQISENATSFSNYNMGLKDRIIEVKESIYPKPNAEGVEEEETTTIKTNFDDNINASGNSLFITIYGKKRFLSENIDSLISHNKTHANLIVGKLTKDNQIQSPFFLPFNFSLEMDGLSGMKLYQKFLMTNDILPTTYADDGVDLQITGINHKIDRDAWLTELTTQSVAAETMTTVARPAELVSTSTTQQSSNQSNSLPLSTTEAPASQDPESITRFNAMQASYNWVFGRDGEVKSMCARWSYNLALNYIKYLKGGNPETRQLSAGGNANNNQEYYNNLTALGYTKTLSVVTKSQLMNSLSTRTWGYGDVVAYYCNDGPPQSSHVRYGHTQIYVGDINSVKWTTSTANNYNTDFPYRARVGDNWTYLIFTAPSTA